MESGSSEKVRVSIVLLGDKTIHEDWVEEHTTVLPNSLIYQIDCIFLLLNRVVC